MCSRASKTVICTILLFAGCASDEGTDLRASEQPTGQAALGKLPVSVELGSEAPRVGTIVQDLWKRPDQVAAVGETSTLLHSPSPGFIGWLSPIALPSIQEDILIYNSWTDQVPLAPGRSFGDQGIRQGDTLGIPTLRSFDPSSNRDELLADAAFSAAISGTGRLAFVQGIGREFRAGYPYKGQIVVRESLQGTTTQWTEEEAVYVAAAWAGESLLAYRIGEGEVLSLVVARGPGDISTFVEYGSLVAVSPAGDLAAIIEYPENDPTQASLTIKHVEDGTVVARVSVAELEGVSHLSYAGSWLEDQIVAAGTDEEGSPLLAFFTLTSDSLTMQDSLIFDPSEFPAGLEEPVFVDDGTTVTARATTTEPPPEQGPRVQVFVECVREEHVCVTSEPYAANVIGTAHNPSRPR